MKNKKSSRAARREGAVVPEEARKLALAVATAGLERKASGIEIIDVCGKVDYAELLEADASFGMVLCDMTMPGISGIQLYETIKQASPELASRFVFMTGGAVYPEARAFVARGERPFIEKPFDRQALMQAVDQVLSPEAPTGS